MLLFCFIQLKAQTLDSLVNEALSNNPLIKSMDFKIRASEFKVESTNTYPAPTIGLEFSQVPFNSINLLNQPLSQNLTFSQMFMLGGKIEAMTDVEKSNVVINQDNLLIYKVNLKASIKMSYFNLWLIDKKIEVQQESIDLLNQLLNSLTKLYEINKISQADIFTINSEIAFNETQLLIFKNQKEVEVYRMNKLLGRDLDSKEIIVSKELSNKELNLSQVELETMLADNNPSLKKLNSLMEKKRKDILSNDKEKIPDLMLKGMIMRMPRGMILTTQSDLTMIPNNMAGSDYGYGLMASINLPFAPWSKNKYDAKEQEINAYIQSIEFEKMDMQRDMNSKLKTSFVKMKTSWELMELYSKNVIPMYENARSSQISLYQNNQTNINTVIDANRMILMQSMNYFMAQADYQMAIAEIEMIVGISVNN
jgi:outer membrane protein TolC